MSDHHSTPGHATDTRRKLGISPAELRAAVAVMSHEAVFGYGPTHAELKRFLGASPKGYHLLARGWLSSKKVGPVAGHTLARWSSTYLAHLALGDLQSDVLQTVSVADWFATSQATYDRATCQKCSVSVGPDQDYCAAHGRLHKQQQESR